MSHSILSELASQREADASTRARRQAAYRNPLRGDATFHEERDLARVIARLRAVAH